MGGLVGVLSILSPRACGMSCHQRKARTIGCSAAMSGGITAKEIELIHRLIAEIQGSEGCMVEHRQPRRCLWFTYVTVLRYVLSHLRECMKMVRRSLQIQPVVKDLNKRNLLVCACVILKSLCQLRRSKAILTILTFQVCFPLKWNERLVTWLANGSNSKLHKFH